MLDQYTIKTTKKKKKNMKIIIINGEAVKPSCYSTNSTVRQLQGKKISKTYNPKFILPFYN